MDLRRPGIHDDSQRSIALPGVYDQGEQSQVQNPDGSWRAMTPDDVRAMQQGDTLWAIVSDWPAQPIVVYSDRATAERDAAPGNHRVRPVTISFQDESP